MCILFSKIHIYCIYMCATIKQNTPMRLNHLKPMRLNHLKPSADNFKQQCTHNALVVMSIKEGHWGNIFLLNNLVSKIFIYTSDKLSESNVLWLYFHNKILYYGHISKLRLVFLCLTCNLCKYLIKIYNSKQDLLNIF